MSIRHPHVKAISDAIAALEARSTPSYTTYGELKYMIEADAPGRTWVTAIPACDVLDKTEAQPTKPPAPHRTRRTGGSAGASRQRELEPQWRLSGADCVILIDTALICV